MKYYFFAFFLFLGQHIHAQHNDRQAGLYNVISSGIIGGIGAIINKKPEQKTGKVFLKGVYQGAIGGYIVFESKRVLREFSRTNDYGYIWPSKILNTVGNSIIMNAASNRDLWERWYINIGFNHLEYDFKRAKKLRYKALPFALIGGCIGFIKGSLDIKRSFASGFFIFKEKYSSQNYEGLAIVNSILYVAPSNEDLSGIIAHEIIHSFQYEQNFSLNAYLDKPISKLEKRNNSFNTYNKIFYTDFNHLFDLGLQGIEWLLHLDYNDRFYEKEAFYYQEYKP